MVLLYSLLFLAILVAVPAGLYLAFHAPAAPVPDQAVLVIHPQGALVEQGDGVSSLVGGLVSDQGEPAVTRDLITALDRARHDDRIKSVLLRLDDFGGAAPGQLQDVIRAIDRFKQSGKPVRAWSAGFNQSQYELASHADSILVDPLGYVLIQGYGVYNNYYKDALDKLGVKINVFRVGKYKSYVEPYTRNDMSPAARADALAWMGSLWSTYHEVVTTGRAFDAKTLDAYINDYADHLSAHNGNAAELAHKAGLVDRVASLDDLRETLVDQVGRDQASGSFHQIDVADYLADTRPPDRDAGGRLAVVTVEGDIIDGQSTPGSAGGETIARLIDTARRDDDVKALLLRVNSPGGSVTAAERIRREVVAMRRAGKPVVVSMAGLAASGGYWISMNANQIWAEPSTITGSIGIFAIVPTFNQPLNKLGIHTDGVGTTVLSGAMRLDRPLSEQAQQILQAGIEHGYQEFIGHVAQARNMTSSRVNEIAQGRVWSGRDAKRIGLVDHLGGVTQAESAAARLAGLDPTDVHLKPMSPPADWRGALSQVIGVHLADTLLPNWLSGVSDDAHLQFLRHLNDPNGLYARCFCKPDTTHDLSAAAYMSPRGD